MNKKIILGALCSLAIMACTKTEEVKVDTNNAITFRTSVNASTRAVVNVENLNAFYVNAFETGKANYITDDKVSSTDNGATWTTTGTYYWTSSIGTLKFFAYAPISLLDDKTNNGVTIQMDKDKQELKGIKPSRNISKGEDVVVAYNEGNKTDNGTSGVSLNFKHVYSQIKVEAKCSSDDYQIKVIGVKLANLNSVGNFIMPTEETKNTTMLQDANYDSVNTPVAFGDFVKEVTKAKTLTAEYASIMTSENNFFVLPQAVTAWKGNTETTGNYISVMCQISKKNADGKTYTQIFPKTADKFAGASVAIGAPTKFLAGKIYTYKLEFFGKDGGAGKLDPQPGKNGNENGNGDGDPNNNEKDGNNPLIDTVNQGEGGDPIIGQPIKFTVTVDDWVEGDTTEIKL